MAQVQIVGLSDRALGPAAAPVSAKTATARQADNFCIVSADGKAVSLAFSSGNGAASDGQSWLAKNTAGTGMAYQQFVANSDGSAEVQVSRSGTATFVLAAGRTVRDSSACGSGNVTKSIAPTGSVPVGGGPYTDVVTVVASPQ